MIHPAFLADMTRLLLAERLAVAERQRRARPPRAPDGPLVLRQATFGDRPALTQLADLEDRELPAGPFLVAELGGELVAALGLGNGQVVANPFRATADLVPLLRLRARQLAR